MRSKIAVVGEKESVLGFKAVGLTTASANDGPEAAAQLHKLAENGYAVIYITEQLAAQIEEDMARYNDTAEVAVIPIPSQAGSLGIGVRGLHLAVERAVGADILKQQ